jgi:hypothetical protein
VQLIVHIDSIRGWCVANNIIRSTDKIRVTTFTGKINSNCTVRLVNISYWFSQGSWSNLDSKLSFHHQVNYIVSQPLNMLVLIFTLTCSFSTTDSLLLLHNTFVRPKLEYDPPVSNSMKKVECIQRKFVALFFSHTFLYNRGWVQVLWGMKLAQFWGPL